MHQTVYAVPTAPRPSRLHPERSFVSARLTGLNQLAVVNLVPLTPSELGASFHTRCGLFCTPVASPYPFSLLIVELFLVDL